MIELSAVDLRLNGRDVLSGVDLRLAEHRIGVIGANGSGKSSLARLLNGLVLPTAGRVSVDGLDTARQGAEVRRRVGFVFSDPDAQIVMPTVAEDIAFSLRRSRSNRAETARRVAEVLTRFDLADHEDHPAHLLSGGQKQLLAFAAVLVTGPRVLVLDEPTTLLDLRNTRRIAEIVAGLDQQVVHVTHQLDLLADYDRVLVVEAGRIVADDEPGPACAFYRRSAGERP